MKTRNWLIIIVAIALVFCAYNYIYKDHRNIETEVAAYILSAKDISDEFNINPGESESKYLNKTIQLTGVVTEISSLQATLEHQVFCQFNDTINTIKLQQRLTIKGRFIGYDDLLEELKLDQCHIIN